MSGVRKGTGSRSEGLLTESLRAEVQGPRGRVGPAAAKKGPWPRGPPSRPPCTQQASRSDEDQRCPETNKSPPSRTATAS